MRLAFAREELRQITKKEGTLYKAGTDYREYRQEIEEARHEHLLVWAKELKIEIKQGVESIPRLGYSTNTQYTAAGVPVKVHHLRIRTENSEYGKVEETIVQRL